MIEESVGNAGATVMGRRMFSGGEGPWEDDPNPDAWWGDEPPFHHPVFILTHHAREPVAKQGGTTFTFVTDGIESALEQARAAAGDKDVAVGGGADVAQQYLVAGLLDEIQIHVAPMFLGGGVRLFDDDPALADRKLESTRYAPALPRREVTRSQAEAARTSTAVSPPSSASAARGTTRIGHDASRTSPVETPPRKTRRTGP